MKNSLEKLFIREKQLQEEFKEKSEQPIIPEQKISPQKEKEQLSLTTPEEEMLESYKIKESTPLSGGSNGVVFIKLENNGPGIFKPQKEECRELRKQVEAGTYFKRERAAYLVDKFLGFDLVPPTVIREINGQLGSVQQFIPDAMSGSESQMGKIKKSERIKLWIFDYIIYNSDRHGGNFLVKDDKIYAIDNGLSFGEDYPKTYETFFNEPIPAETSERIKRFLSWKEGQKICKDLLLELLPLKEVKACIKRIEKIGQLLAKHGMIPGEAEAELTF